MVKALITLIEALAALVKSLSARIEDLGEMDVAFLLYFGLAILALLGVMIVLAIIYLAFFSMLVSVGS